MRQDRERLLPREGLVTAEEAGRFLSRSTRQVYLDARAGRLPSVRLGGRVRFSVGALRDLADRRQP